MAAILASAARVQAAGVAARTSSTAARRLPALRLQSTRCQATVSGLQACEALRGLARVAPSVPREFLQGPTTARVASPEQPWEAPPGAQGRRLCCLQLRGAL